MCFLDLERDGRPAVRTVGRCINAADSWHSSDVADDLEPAAISHCSPKSHTRLGAIMRVGSIEGEGYGRSLTLHSQQRAFSPATAQQPDTAVTQCTSTPFVLCTGSSPRVSERQCGSSYVRRARRRKQRLTRNSCSTEPRRTCLRFSDGSTHGITERGAGWLILCFRSSGRDMEGSESALLMEMAPSRISVYIAKVGDLWKQHDKIMASTQAIIQRNSIYGYPDICNIDTLYSTAAGASQRDSDIHPMSRRPHMQTVLRTPCRRSAICGTR